MTERRLVRVSDSLPPTATSSFDSDWRGQFMRTVRRELADPGLGVVRLDIVRAIARARTPGEAATLVHEAAKGYELAVAHRHVVASLVASMMNKHVKEDAF